MKETHIYKQKVKLKETITFSYFYLVQFLKNVLKRSFKIYWSSKTLKLLKESVEDCLYTPGKYISGRTTEVLIIKEKSLIRTHQIKNIGSAHLKISLRK
jgi:hypothetical protein